MSTVIAVDGPSGSGKSSTARAVAQRLGYAYLDTGAMYRAMTWALLARGVDTSDASQVADAAPSVVIVSGVDPGDPTIEADGVDVSAPIRGDQVTSHVSLVASVPEVRDLMVRLQRSIIAAHDGGIVVEGRDIGSTVAPDARLKVYLVADPAARAARRAAEEGGSDHSITRESLIRRDQIDSTRTASPLVKSDGAVEIDSTYRSLDEVVDLVIELADR